MAAGWRAGRRGGRIDWRFETIRLEDVVRQALAATAALFEVSGLAGELTVDDGLPAVRGDRDRLVQVVVNLVSNAVKFTPHGMVRVGVARDGDGVRVVVSDTGRGVPAHDLERIVEPFRQASDTLPEAPMGTGLGLPISRQIVEAHGGTMGVESAPGAGSTFWFRVPPPGDAATGDHASGTGSVAAR